MDLNEFTGQVVNKAYRFEKAKVYTRRDENGLAVGQTRRPRRLEIAKGRCTNRSEGCTCRNFYFASEYTPWLGLAPCI